MSILPAEAPAPDVPAPDFEGEGAVPEEHLPAHHPPPVSPAAFREEARKRKKRGCLIKLIVVLAVVGGGLGFALTKMTPEELIESVKTLTDDYVLSYYKDFTGKKVRDAAYAETGLVSVRQYRSKKLPGLEGETSGPQAWEIQEEGKTYLVVEIDAAPRHFLPSDENYERILKEAEIKKERDPSYEVPPREQCRLFDPAAFQLTVGEGEPMKGVLIKINYGANKGFYELFHVFFPKATGAEGEVNLLEKAMLLSVAFAVPESGTDLSTLKIQFKELAAAVPAPEK